MREGTCSFLELKDLFLDLAKDHSEVKYIFRPHPLMANEMRRENKQVWDDYIARFEDIPNAELDDNPDYTFSFTESTVLVSDISSMMFEYMLTEKPVIYMYKKDVLSSFAQLLSDGLYTVYSASELKEKLEILRDGIDPIQQTRANLMNSVLKSLLDNPSEKIKNYLIKDFESRKETRNNNNN